MILMLLHFEARNQKAENYLFSGLWHICCWVTHISDYLTMPLTDIYESFAISYLYKTYYQ